MLSDRRSLLRRSSRSNCSRSARASVSRIALIFALQLRLRLATSRRDDEEPERPEHAGEQHAGDVGGRRRRDKRHNGAEAERAGAHGGGRRHGVARALGESRGLAVAVVAVDHALGFAPDRVDQARALDMEGRRLGIADDPIAVLAAALGQVRRDLLPLPEVGVDEPVDQLAHATLDLARRVGDDLRARSPPARARC